MLLTLLIAAAVPEPDTRPSLPPCAGPKSVVETPCAMPIRIAPRATRRLLGERSSAWWVAGDQLTVVTRISPGEARLCCAIQTGMTLIGEGLSAVTVRIPRIDEAIFDVLVVDGKSSPEVSAYRGPRALPAPPKANPLAGKIVPFTIMSKALGEERSGSIYVPPGVAPDAKLPVIYLADGATRSFAPILEGAIATGRARPALIVGIDSPTYNPECKDASCNRRTQEYMLDFHSAENGSETPFFRHLRFVTNEVMPMVERDYPASMMRAERITSGFSAGGAWALAAAESRPDLFGNVLAMSSGSGAAATNATRLKDARVYAGAGLFEPPFLDSTRRATEVAKAAGATVQMRVLPAGHSFTMWDIVFADGVAWLIPAQP